MAECVRSNFLSGDRLQASCSFSRSARPNRRRGLVAFASHTGVLDSHLVLGLDHSASKQEIKRAYRNLALQYHPDVCKGSDNKHLFIRINLAYESLMNESQDQTKAADNFSQNQSSRMEEEWLSEGYTFEEIFGNSFSFSQGTVEESVFQDVKPKSKRKGCMREDW